MDDPSPDLDTRAYGCRGWDCLIVVVIAVVVVILNVTGIYVAS
jgi:hypothetical protein